MARAFDRADSCQPCREQLRFGEDGMPCSCQWQAEAVILVSILRLGCFDYFSEFDLRLDEGKRIGDVRHLRAPRSIGLHRYPRD